MKHGLYVRGIAAASLALASNTASAATTVSACANGLPVVAMSDRVSAGLTADDTLPSWFTQRAVSASEAKPAFDNSVRLRRPLAELVRDHAAAIVSDEGGGCLAGAGCFEARGESLEGLLAGAEVVR